MQITPTMVTFFIFVIGGGILLVYLLIDEMKRKSLSITLSKASLISNNYQPMDLYYLNKARRDKNTKNIPKGRLNRLDKVASSLASDEYMINDSNLRKEAREAQMILNKRKN